MEEQVPSLSPSNDNIEEQTASNNQDEDPPSVWDELGGLDPDALLIPTTSSIYPESTDPSQSAQDPWNWLRPPPLAPSIQVRLDGEPAANITPSQSIDLDQFLYPLPVATGRVIKSDSSTISNPSISKPKLKSQSTSINKEENNLIKSEPDLILNESDSMTDVTTSPTSNHHLVVKEEPSTFQLQSPSNADTKHIKSEPQPPISAITSPQKSKKDVDMTPVSVSSPVNKTKSKPVLPSAISVDISTPSTNISQLETKPLNFKSPSSPIDPKIPNPPSSLKEKRAREARQFPKEVLGSLDGTTSAEVRKMNATQRELVLYKRKLRNRESARRSRQKRQATLAELQEEIDDLMQVSERMVEVGLSLREENNQLRGRLVETIQELETVRNSCATVANSKSTAQEDSPAALQMKLGG